MGGLLSSEIQPSEPVKITGKRKRKRRQSSGSAVPRKRRRINPVFEDGNINNPLVEELLQENEMVISSQSNDISKESTDTISNNNMEENVIIEEISTDIDTQPKHGQTEQTMITQIPKTNQDVIESEKEEIIVIETVDTEGEEKNTTILNVEEITTTESPSSQIDLQFSPEHPPYILYKDKHENVTNPPFEITDIKFQNISQNFFKGAKWSPDGTCLLTSAEDNFIRLYEM